MVMYALNKVKGMILNMKRIFQILILLFVFYYLIQVIFNFFDKGYDITYTKSVGDKEISIREVYSANQKNERNNYYFEVKVDNNVFYLKTYENFNKVKNIISDIKYFESGEYTCILPIYKGGKILTDIICKNNETTTYYHNIKGINTQIDSFAYNISEYNSSQWLDNETETTGLGNVYVYKNNLDNNLYLGLTNYKGLYNINDKASNKIISINVFKNDIYNPKINAQISHYYLVADYNENYEFSKFYLIDLIKKETETIESKNKISLNSYIQGSIGNSVYLIDIDNKKQYEIDIKSKKIIEIGNSDSGIKFYNAGEWENRSIFETIKNEEKFIYKKIDSTKFNVEYARIDQIGGEKSGYYYLYRQNGNGYNVYKAYVEQPNNPIFLFQTSSIDHIKYIGDTILYIDKNFAKIYSDNNGIKNLIRYDELEFNKNLDIFGYYLD